MNIVVKKVIGTIGMSIVSGAAISAGSSLWNDVLKEKVYDIANDCKKKKKKDINVIQFRKRGEA